MLGPSLISLVLATCPPGMVFATAAVCIDRLPWPNDEEAPTQLALSALPEPYLNLRGVTWDLETLCASRGKRVCTAEEWTAACEGTPREECPSQALEYRVPHWGRVAARDPFELMILDRHSSWRNFPACAGQTGARMMGTAQEWVRLRGGYAFSRGFWSREGGCPHFIRSHSPTWHDYATSGRCCTEATR